MSKTVLVTGASGFIASHVIKYLLERNYKIVGTVRDLRAKEKYEHLFNLIPAKKDDITIVQADLSKEEGWLETMKGVDMVAHIASPFHNKSGSNPEENYIKPAVMGTRYVLEAAIKAGVKRVVMTSSCVAIGYGKNAMKKFDFTEEDWSDNPKRIYDRSKTEAEREAWKIYEENKDKLNLTILNPSIVVGPLLNKRKSATVENILEIWNAPLLPRFCFGWVGVNDLAKVYVRAFEEPEKTRGQRYIVNDKSLLVKEVADIFRKEFKQYGYSFASWHAPKFGFCMMMLFNHEGYHLKDFWGKKYTYDHSKVEKDLNFKFSPVEDELIEMVYSLIKYGFIKDKVKGKRVK